MRYWAVAVGFGLVVSCGADTPTEVMEAAVSGMEAADDTAPEHLPRHREICDGKDNDGDGRVDEDLPEVACEAACQVPCANIGTCPNDDDPLCALDDAARAKLRDREWAWCPTLPIPETLWVTLPAEDIAPADVPCAILVADSEGLPLAAYTAYGRAALARLAEIDAVTRVAIAPDLYFTGE